MIEITLEVVEKCFCWDRHPKINRINLSLICACITSVSGYKNEVLRKVVRDVLFERGFDNPKAKIFLMPEFTSWCGCEPKMSEFRKLVREFRKELGIVVFYK